MKCMVQELTPEEIGSHEDSRGYLRFFESWRIDSFHLGSMRPTAVRGNHVHDRDEIVCLLGAVSICRVELRDNAGGSRMVFTVDRDPAMYRIRAGVRHTLTNTGERTFYLVSFLAPPASWEAAPL